MTDTAVPLPELPDYTEPATDGPILTIDQRRRVEALQVARQILESKPGLFAGSKVEANRAVYDLTFLGDWIIDGPDNNPEPTEYVDIRNGHGELVVRIPVACPGGTPEYELQDVDADEELRAARSDADDGV